MSLSSDQIASAQAAADAQMAAAHLAEDAQVAAAHAAANAQVAAAVLGVANNITPQEAVDAQILANASAASAQIVASAQAASAYIAAAEAAAAAQIAATAAAIEAGVPTDVQAATTATITAIQAAAAAHVTADQAAASSHVNAVQAAATAADTAIQGAESHSQAGTIQDSYTFVVASIQAEYSLYVANDLSRIAACFIPNTLISTPIRSIPVQDLQIGDLILNHLGESVPVKWIGTQRFHPAFAGDKLPICISAGALGNGLPLRDLYVSPHHAMYVDDCLLIEAKALINGTTINQVTQWEGDIEYLHIETEHHEIILAEGAPAETFMDHISRTCFNNYSQYQELYPEDHEMMELDIPRVRYQRQLPNAVKRKLEAISEVLMGGGHGVKAQMVG
jgi:hypothetical protein